MRVAGEIRHRLLLRETFIKLVLGSVHFAEAHPSALAPLQQDKPTSLALSKLIAEFAGVPVGKEFGQLLRARTALADYGYTFWLPKNI